jgi:hypothetical protein
LLNQREGANANAVEDGTSRSKPENFDYSLPSVAQWRLGMKSKRSLLSGVDTEPYEWTSNQHQDGTGASFPQHTFFKKTPLGSYPVAILGNTPVTLEPSTTASISAGTPGAIRAYWTHKIGFRVVLIPNQP